MPIRLQRYLAQAGVASRRKCEDLIAAGLVTVNGQVVTQPGVTVEPAKDSVALRGEPVRPRFAEADDPGLGLVLHKPAGVITARSDPAGRRTVYDLLEEPTGTRLVYVGRLDRDTEGVLLFTTNGTLAHRLTHPRWGIERVYEAYVSGPLKLDKLKLGARRGVMLSDGRTGQFRVEIMGERARGVEPRWHLELRLAEGRKREVRRIVEACGGDVERLVRTRFASIGLGSLAPGEWRRLDETELDRLMINVGMESG